MFSSLRASRRTLSARLIAEQLALLALVCVVVGVVALLLVRDQLVNQLDRQLSAASERATYADHHGPPPDGSGGIRPGPGGPSVGSRERKATE